MKHWFSIISFSFFSFTLTGQINFAPPSLTKERVNTNMDSLNINSKYSVYLSALLGAVNYYPELKKIRIKVVSKKMNMLMKVRPTIVSAIRKPVKRKYKIFINSTNKSGTPTPDDFTFNAQVGVFAHELSHICDYLNMPFKKLFHTARHYKENSFKKSMEQKTDKMTLEHGLGWQLYDYAVQWNKLGNKYNKYVIKKNEFYMNSTQMLGIMMELGYN